MSRAFLFVLDSFGVGGATDADAYGDLGSNTLGHIAEFCAAGAADRAGLRQGPLTLPNMSSIGLLDIARLASGEVPAGIRKPERPFGLHGPTREVSPGQAQPPGTPSVARVGRTVVTA